VPPGLQLIDLRRRFGDVVALDGVSFDVDEGTVVGFVGPNGAGKTTAMRIALGVLEADSGEVRWRGRPVDAAARRRFSYIPEELIPLAGRVYAGAILRIGAKVRIRDAWRAAA
jgi:ABC-type multidrug transport system ATPase subunit